MHEISLGMRDLRIAEELWEETTEQECVESAGIPHPGQEWSPAADLSEDSEAYHVVVDTPGARSACIDIECSRQRLTVFTVRRPAPDEQARRYHSVGRPHGPMRLVLDLPGAVRPEKLSWRLRFGEIRIRIPKAGRNVLSIYESESGNEIREGTRGPREPEEANHAG